MPFSTKSPEQICDRDGENPLVFEEILAPIMPLIAEEAAQLKDDADTYTLSFQPFTLNLLFGLISGIKSIGLLVTEIKTSTEAKTFTLVRASKSMYSEAFARYRAIFSALLQTMRFLKIPEIQALGRFYCVDGLVFPAIITMTWAVLPASPSAAAQSLPPRNQRRQNGSRRRPSSDGNNSRQSSTAFMNSPTYSTWRPP